MDLAFGISSMQGCPFSDIIEEVCVIFVVFNIVVVYPIYLLTILVVARLESQNNVINFSRN